MANPTGVESRLTRLEYFREDTERRMGGLEKDARDLRMVVIGGLDEKSQDASLRGQVRKLVAVTGEIELRRATRNGILIGAITTVIGTIFLWLIGHFFNLAGL